MLSPEIKHPLYFEGCHPIIARQCKLKKLPYPPLDKNGEIIADEQFWQALKHA
jgi:tRNA (guanosine-2'-O-)-methyltransferase